MRLPLDTLDGMREFDVPTGLVKDLLHFICNTNGWKNAPELLHDKAVRFRRDVAEQRKPGVPPKVAG